ncbi:MAG: cob(I)yrinic acid a,c-diamide adenosyltransferase [Angustibacter sp.]
MVVLSRIYTRTGDDGTTALGDFTRTTKTDPRLVAYADCDETGAALGVAITCGELPGDVIALLQRIQNDLFDVGADLCTPLATSYEHPPLRVQEPWIGELEQHCDRFGHSLPTLRSFILAGGTVGSAYLHVARTVARRAERSAWAAIDRYGAEADGGVSPLTARYLNRLSDLLFILGRFVNQSAEAPEVLWKPGADRDDAALASDAKPDQPQPHDPTESVRLTDESPS